MHPSDQPVAVLAGADLSVVRASIRRNDAHPADRAGIVDPLSRAAGPEGAGKSGVKRWAKNHTRKDPTALIDQIFEALAQQSVVVPGTATVELIIPRVAAQIKELKAQRALVAAEVEALVDAHPLTQVLISLPGVGITTAATILLTAGDFSSFPTPGHLAAYAGIAPVRRRSGTSIRGLRRVTTRSPRPITTRNALKAKNTTRR